MKIQLYNDSFENVIENIKNKDVIIVSDPPYNIQFKYNTYHDNLSDNDYIKMIAKFKGMKCVLIHYPEYVMKYFVPALGVPKKIITWCYNSNLPGRQHRLICFWNCTPDLSKDFQPYKNPNDKRIKKLIESGRQGARLYDWWADIPLVKNVSKNKIGNTHPCPVPVKLMERIIKTTVCEETVFDPFMGSGTTGIASKKLGRAFVGSEIDEEYFNIAKERLDNEI